MPLISLATGGGTDFSNKFILLGDPGDKVITTLAEAKAAGIGNPKRIYVMRKQIRGRQSAVFLRLLGQLLEVEAALKRGTPAGDAFRDGFLLTAS